MLWSFFDFSEVLQSVMTGKEIQKTSKNSLHSPMSCSKILITSSNKAMIEKSKCLRMDRELITGGRSTMQWTLNGLLSGNRNNSR